MVQHVIKKEVYFTFTNDDIPPNVGPGAHRTQSLSSFQGNVSSRFIQKSIYITFDIFDGNYLSS